MGSYAYELYELTVWCNTKRIQSDFGWYFADIVVYPHCAYNELQKQDEMEGSEYTNFLVHVLTKIRNKNINKGILYLQIPLKEKTSIQKVVSEIHTANPI